MGYDRHDAAGTSARCLVELVKRNLDRDTHYIIDDGTSAVDRLGCFSSQPIRKGVKLNYWLTRVGFYEVCMTSAKPKAIKYRHEFGKIYEFALLWCQTHKNNLLRQLPDPEASLIVATHRTDVKKQMKESKTELCKVKKENDDLKNALFELEQQVQEKDRLIASQKRTIRSLEGHRMDKLFLIEQTGGIEEFMDVFPTAQLPKH